MELLVAIVIEAIIVGALGMAFVGILQGTTQVNQSLSRSGDARIAGGLHHQRRRATRAGPRSRSPTPPRPRRARSAGRGRKPVVRFDWTSTSSAGGTTRQHRRLPARAEHHALRLEQADAPRVRERRAVSDAIGRRTSRASPSPVRPTADCSGTPTSITVTVTETPTPRRSQYIYSLTGTFRKLIGGGTPTTPAPPSRSSCSVRVPPAAGARTRSTSPGRARCACTATRSSTRPTARRATR